MVTCKKIADIVKLAETEGNSIISLSDSEKMKEVIWMDKPMNDELKEKVLKNISGLRYEKTKNQPHNPSVEYFACDKCKSLVAFPI